MATVSDIADPMVGIHTHTHTRARASAHSLSHPLMATLSDVRYLTGPIVDINTHARPRTHTHPHFPVPA